MTDLPDAAVDAALNEWLPGQEKLHTVPAVRGALILAIEAPTVGHALDRWDDAARQHEIRDADRLEEEDQAPYFKAEPKRTVKARTAAMHAARVAAYTVRDSAKA